MRAEAQEAARLLLNKLGLPYSFMPEIREALIKSGKTSTTLANFREGIDGLTKDVITINTDKKAVAIGVRNIRSAVKDGWITQPNTILHELSHKVHSQLYNEIVRTPRWRDADATFRLDRNVIKQHVSKYGATNNKEFHAELISGILKGRKYPKQILDDSILSKSDNKVARKLYRMGLKK